MLDIELLVVPDCAHEESALDLIETAVRDTRVRATVRSTTIATESQAVKRGFIGSPTILLNGSDPFPVPDAPVALACRLYATPDGLRGVPGLRDLRRALKQAAAG